jgi:hypothetical protein
MPLRPFSPVSATVASSMQARRETIFRSMNTLARRLRNVPSSWHVKDITRILYQIAVTAGVPIVAF